MPRISHPLLAGACLLVTSAAQAAPAVPALYLETRLFSLWSVGIALVLACVLLRVLYALPWWRMLGAALLAKLCATLAGALLMPIAGFAWELPAPVYRQWFGWAGFDPLCWAATLLFACLLHAGVDGLVYRYAFRLALRRRVWGWVLVVNVLSVALAFASLYVVPVE